MCPTYTAQYIDNNLSHARDQWDGVNPGIRLSKHGLNCTAMEARTPLCRHGMTSYPRHPLAVSFVSDGQTPVILYYFPCYVAALTFTPQISPICETWKTF